MVAKAAVLVFLPALLIAKDTDATSWMEALVGVAGDVAVHSDSGYHLAKQRKDVKIDISKERRQQVTGSTPTGAVELGTPAVTMSVIFDTGSDQFVAKTWTTIHNELKQMDGGVAEGDVVASKQIYDHNRSKTFARQYVNRSGHLEPRSGYIAYGSGVAITDVGNDTLKVGGNDLNNFPISEISADSLTMLHRKEGAQGILGLQHMLNRSLGESVFSRVRDLGLMTAFGYCRDNAKDAGMFIWGDRATEGHEIPVVGQMHWAITMRNVKIASGNDNNQKINDSSEKHPSGDKTPANKEYEKTGTKGGTVGDKKGKQDLENVDKKDKDQNEWKGRKEIGRKKEGQTRQGKQERDAGNDHMKENDADGKVDSKPDSKADSKADSKLDSTGGSNTDSNADSMAGRKGDSKADSKAASKAASKLGSVEGSEEDSGKDSKKDNEKDAKNNGKNNDIHDDTSDDNTDSKTDGKKDDKKNIKRDNQKDRKEDGKVSNKARDSAAGKANSKADSKPESNAKNKDGIKVAQGDADIDNKDEYGALSEDEWNEWLGLKPTMIGSLLQVESNAEESNVASGVADGAHGASVIQVEDEVTNIGTPYAKSLMDIYSKAKYANNTGDVLFIDANVRSPIKETVVSKRHSNLHSKLRVRAVERPDDSTAGDYSDDDEEDKSIVISQDRQKKASQHKVTHDASNHVAGLCSTGTCAAIIDTGSNIIAGPTADIQALVNRMNVKTDCSNFEELPDMTLNLGRMDITLPPSAYIMKVKLPSSMGKKSLADKGEDAASASMAAMGPGDRLGKWGPVFDSLKSRGVDLEPSLSKGELQHLASLTELCMPALVSLDKQTSHGPLWVVGTPLFDQYYTRWSWAANDDAPKIFIKPLDEAAACSKTKDESAIGASSSSNSRVGALIRAEARATVSRSHTPSHHLNEPPIRHPDEIRYPHWAASLVHL